jgi:hypothetical protein
LISLPREVETAAKKREQLVGGPESELTPRIDLFDSPLEVAIGRPCFRSEMQNECASHSVSVDTPMAKGVKVSFNAGEI